MLHFRLGPFPVRIDGSFLITALMFGWFGSRNPVDIAIWVGIVFVSVLVHELGHAVVGLAQGGTPEIVLQGMGGVTFPRLRTRTSWPQQVLLSVAGPVAGLLPGVIGLAVLASRHETFFGNGQHLWREILQYSFSRDPLDRSLATLAEMSAIWTALNLMPVIPLDGGHVLEVALGAIRKKPSAVLASWISAIFAALLAIVIYFLAAGWWTAAIFFGYLAVLSVGRARQLSRGAPVAGRTAAPDAAMQAQIADALARARSALNAKDFEVASAVADTLDAAPDPFRQAAAARIRAGIALAGGQFLEAGRQAGRAFSLAPGPDAAVVAARAALRGGQTEVAQTWLKRALESGAPLQALRDDSELSVLIG